jgi:hypothetical protein
VNVETFPSKAGLRTAGVGLLIGAAGSWFLIAVLTASKSVCYAGVALTALSAAGYTANWVARGRTDGQ